MLENAGRDRRCLMQAYLGGSSGFNVNVRKGISPLREVYVALTVIALICSNHARRDGSATTGFQPNPPPAAFPRSPFR